MDSELAKSLGLSDDGRLLTICLDGEYDAPAGAGNIYKGSDATND